MEVLDRRVARALDSRATLRETAVLYGISDREMQVVNAMLEGLHVTEIAQEMGISDSTVVFHMKRMLVKTGARNRVQLAALMLGHIPLTAEELAQSAHFRR